MNLLDQFGNWIHFEFLQSSDNEEKKYFTIWKNGILIHMTSSRGELIWSQAATELKLSRTEWGQFGRLLESYFHSH